MKNTRKSVNLVLYLNMVHKRYGLEYVLSTPQQTKFWRSPGWDHQTQGSCQIRCGTIMIPPCLKFTGADHSPKFCSPSPNMVTSLREQTVIWWDVKQQIDTQRNKQKIGEKLTMMELRKWANIDPPAISGRSM